ncbi:MAG: symmetrical bis(5'-nucleosyl)-tetraphosphatase, partial [Gammaproteobacteria bacterium]
WFVGDLVNRGKDSLATLRFVHGLGERALTVLGNHDLHLLAVAHGHRRAKAGDTIDDVLHAPDRDELLDWLRRRPLLHRDDATGFVMVHAGIPHIWDLDEATARAREVEEVLAGDDYDELLAGMYGDQPVRWRDSLRDVKRLRVIINYLTRMRVIDTVGKLELNFNEGLCDIPKGYRPWFEFYNAQPQPFSLVFGHWAALNGECGVDGMYALDTGCVWGNALSALRLVPLERFSATSVE